APPALSGTFVSEYGTLTFNGDGRTVSANVPDYFTGEGTYVFLFRNEEFRYDKAETFRITIDGQNYSFLINRGLTDGETFVFDLTGSGEGVAFRRTD
ncbi:MAG: hypothetical protein ILO53_06155, partial [Clostridia bacterium]|nr:hypothetical protein [Clostridia bacterium]